MVSAETVRIVDSTFQLNSGYGVAIEDWDGEVEFDRNTIRDNDKPMAVHPELVASLGRQNQFMSEANNRIELLSGSADYGGSWQNLGVPIYAPLGLEVTESLLLNAGVRVQFAPGTALVVGDYFPVELRAAGTADNPVIFESAVPGQPWLGVRCEEAGYTDFVGVEFRDAPALSCP